MMKLNPSSTLKRLAAVVEGRPCVKRQTPCNVSSSRSCLLLSLLSSTLASAPSVAALSPVVAVLLTVGSEDIAAAHSKGCGCEAVGEIDLRADGVGEV